MATTETISKTRSGKAAWLGDRYWKFGRDEAFQGILQEIFVVDDTGEITSEPLRDSLTNETSGAMILASSGVGKTALAQRVFRSLPAFAEAGPGTPGNTLMVTVPPEATIKSLAQQIAERTGYGRMAPRIRAHEAWTVARNRMRSFGINLLVIDEAHHLLRPGPGRDVAGAVQTLKHLLQGDDAVAVILIGVPKLREAILQDPETDRRFIKFQLSIIRSGTLEAERFARCVAMCARELQLSLDPEDRFPERLLFAEHGEVGRCIELAKRTLRRALNTGREAMHLADAEECFEMLYGPQEMTPFSPGEWGAVKATLESTGWGR